MFKALGGPTLQNRWGNSLRLGIRDSVTGHSHSKVRDCNPGVLGLGCPQSNADVGYLGEGFLGSTLLWHCWVALWHHRAALRHHHSYSLCLCDGNSEKDWAWCSCVLNTSPAIHWLSPWRAESKGPDHLLRPGFWVQSPALGWGRSCRQRSIACFCLHRCLEKPFHLSKQRFTQTPSTYVQAPV